MTPEEKLWLLLVQSGIKVMKRRDAAEILKEAQQDAYEEAAKICKLQIKDWSPTENAKAVALETAKDIARAIRALKDKP